MVATVTQEALEAPLCSAGQQAGHSPPRRGPQAARPRARGPVRPPPGQAARRTYLRKKEAAADGPVEPPAGAPGAGLTRPHVFDVPSEPTGGGPSRTVSATATAATAASAWREGEASVRLGHPAPHRGARGADPTPQRPACSLDSTHTGPPAWGPVEERWAQMPRRRGLTFPPTSSSRIAGTNVVRQMDRDPLSLRGRPAGGTQRHA